MALHGGAYRTFDGRLVVPPATVLYITRHGFIVVCGN